jgi:hypothetical protein
LTKSLSYTAIAAIAVSVVVVGIVLMPLATAGTLDPCEAVSRIVAKKMPKSNLPEPWGTIADELAVKVAAAEARNHGILACYRIIPKALNLTQTQIAAH